MWYVYILKCADGTLYTGVTNDLKRRVAQHNSSELGAKYTKGRRPVELMYSKRKKTRATAQKEEHEIKQLAKTDKMKLINP